MAFGALLPPLLREKGGRYWTPIAVARRAALRFAERGIRQVFDVGCGPGKFCIAAAIARPDLSFWGIDRSADLTTTAKMLAARLRVSNIEFEHGNALDAPWHDFDGFYFFNPFEADSDLGSSGADTDPQRVVELLGAAARGTTVITYHGLGGAIPSTYDLISDEPVGTARLRVWVKNRSKGLAWYHLDYAHGVLRVPRWHFERWRVARKLADETTTT